MNQMHKYHQSGISPCRGRAHINGAMILLECPSVVLFGVCMGCVCACVCIVFPPRSKYLARLPRPVGNQSKQAPSKSQADPGSCTAGQAGTSTWTDDTSRSKAV